MRAQRPIRFLTLNIAHGRGLSSYQGFHGVKGIERNLLRISHLFKREAPDIIALQEVDAYSHWNKRINLLEYLKSASGYRYSYMGINNLREGRKPLIYGNAILSRYAISYAENQPFGNAALGEKGFLYAEIQFHGEVLPVVNLHLDFRSRKRRITQIERLIEFLEARHVKSGSEGFLSPIVCGDFNSRATKQRDAVRHLVRYLSGHCAYQILPNGGKTFPALMPTHGLDFIFVPPSFKIKSCKVLRAYVSDHRPVIADLEMRTGNEG